jgi:Cu-Zn family superoxide dismutase
MRAWTIGLVMAAAATGGCANADRAASASDGGSASATAVLRDAGGATKASATAEQTGESVRIRVEAQGLPQGAYGLHVHAVGRCDPPDFATAGPHWNPTGRQHGKSNPQGAHLGDLPNLMVGTDGQGSIEAVIASSTIRGGSASLLDDDGAALMIHAAADDYRTDPSGNSGARIACGVLG